MRNSESTLIGFIAGAAIGAVAGILLAPEKGSLTQERLGREAKRIKREMDMKIRDLQHQIEIQKIKVESYADGFKKGTQFEETKEKLLGSKS